MAPAKASGLGGSTGPGLGSLSTGGGLASCCTAAAPNHQGIRTTSSKGRRKNRVMIVPSFFLFRGGGWPFQQDLVAFLQALSDLDLLASFAAKGHATLLVFAVFARKIDEMAILVEVVRE